MSDEDFPDFFIQFAVVVGRADVRRATVKVGAIFHTSDQFIQFLATVTACYDNRPTVSHAQRVKDRSNKQMQVINNTHIGRIVYAEPFGCSAAGQFLNTEILHIVGKCK